MRSAIAKLIWAMQLRAGHGKRVGLGSQGLPATPTVEICDVCGAPANPPGSYWFAPNDLWNTVIGGSLREAGGFRCIPCFTRACQDKGIHVAWTTAKEWTQETAS